MEFKSDKFFELYDNKNGVAKYEYLNDVITKSTYDDEDEYYNSIECKYDNFGNSTYFKHYYGCDNYHNTYDNNGILIKQEKINEKGEIERKVIENEGKFISYYRNDDEKPFRTTSIKEYDEPIQIKYSTVTDSYEDGEIKEESYHIDDINKLTIIRNTTSFGAKDDTDFDVTIKNTNDTVSDYKINSGFIHMNQYDNNGNLIKRVLYEPSEISLVEYDKYNNINLMETMVYNDNIEDLLESTKCTNVYNDQNQLVEQIRETITDEDGNDIPTDWYKGTNGCLFEDYNI